MEKPTANGRPGPPLATVFALMRPEFSEVVVERALRSRGKAPARVRSALEKALRSNVRVPGFKDTSRAPEQLLTGPALTVIKRGNGRLAGAMLRVWDESQAPLRECVTEHLRTAEVSLVKPDYKANRFTATWLVEEWVRHREALASTHQQFNEDEVALMLCLVAGRAPVPELEEAVARIESDFFRGLVDQLIGLSSESPAWSDINLFTATASKIAEEKSKEKVESQTKAVAEAIDYIQEQFKDEIKYLGLNVQLWFPEVKGRIDLVDEVLGLLRLLTKELEAYRPIRPQGSSLEDERRRAKERGNRESAILRMANKEWEEITAKPEPAAAVAEQRAVYGVGGSPVSSEEIDSMKNEVEQLQVANQEIVKEKARLHDTNSGLLLEKKQLKGQLDEIEESLAQSKKDAQYWREQYEAQKAHVDDGDAEAPAEFASVAAAIARAEETFPGKLLFALNNKSRKDMPFQKPQEVFDALSWLATEFHRERPDDVNPDLTLSIRKACPGWFYKPNQTKTTMGMHPDWYRTTVNGKTFELSNHIGKGTSFDPRSTIRIAFAWDDENEQVVVGYVGTHQRNRQS